MIEIRTSEPLQRWLLESGHLARLWDQPRFFFPAEEFEAEVAGVRVQYPRFTTAEAEARAALRLLGKEEGRGRAVVLGGPRRWTRRERLFLLAAVALAAALVALLFAPRAHAQSRSLGIAATAAPQGFRSALGHPSSPPRPAAAGFASSQGGQPGGIIIRLANSGTALATMPAGLLQFNCSTGMNCTFAAGSGSNPPTFTLTTTGGGGSGCIPPGTTANALLFDAGSGGCSDVAKFTWNSGTSTLTLASGGIFDPTAGTVKVPGSSGQLLFNNGGSLGAEDPIVSGPDDTGVAPTKNPVQTGALDNSTACSSGPCARSFILANGTPAGTEYGLITRPIVSGTQTVTGTVTANQGGTWTVQPGNTANTTAWLVTGTGGTFPATCAAANCAVNEAQIGGSNVVADPCQQQARSSANINLTAGGRIIAGASGRQTYICSLDLITATAQNIALVEGTGTTCGTSTTGMAGGATAATGWNFAANGGLVKGTGPGWVFKTATAADDVCLLLSGSGQTSGSAQYVQQ